MNKRRVKEKEQRFYTLRAILKTRRVINMREKMPRRLPTVKYNGKKYFIDWRLREFRTVDSPLEFVPFESELGREIDGSWG